MKTVYTVRGKFRQVSHGVECGKKLCSFVLHAYSVNVQASQLPKWCNKCRILCVCIHTRRI